MRNMIKLTWMANGLLQNVHYQQRFKYKKILFFHAHPQPAHILFKLDCTAFSKNTIQ